MTTPLFRPAAVAAQTAQHRGAPEAISSGAPRQGNAMDILVLCLVLLGIAQGLLLALVAEHGTNLLFGALAAAAAQMGAAWTLRKHYPEAARKAVLHLPAPRALLAWTTLCLVSVGAFTLT